MQFLTKFIKIKTTVKIFTILLSVFYILGLYCAFYNYNIQGIIFTFLLFLSAILFSELNYKKIIFLFLIFILGILRVDAFLKPIENVLSEIESYKTTLYGQIVSSKDISFEKQRVRFNILVNTAETKDKKYTDLNSKVLVYLNFKNPNDKKLNGIKIGDFIKVEGKLTVPKRAGNPYQFDYSKYLLNNDIKNVLYSDIDDFSKIDSNKIIQEHKKTIKSQTLKY